MQEPMSNNIIPGIHQLHLLEGYKHFIHHTMSSQWKSNVQWIHTLWGCVIFCSYSYGTFLNVWLKSMKGGKKFKIFGIYMMQQGCLLVEGPALHSVVSCVIIPSKNISSIIESFLWSLTVSSLTLCLYMLVSSEVKNKTLLNQAHTDLFSFV